MDMHEADTLFNHLLTTSATTMPERVIRDIVTTKKIWHVFSEGTSSFSRWRGYLFLDDERIMRLEQGSGILKNVEIFSPMELRDRMGSKNYKYLISRVNSKYGVAY